MMIDDEILELNLEIDNLIKTIYIYCLESLPDLREIEDEDLKRDSMLNLRDFKDALQEAFERMGEIEVSQEDMEWLDD